MIECVLLDHGSGGRRSRELVRKIFFSRLGNEILAEEGDAALVGLPTDNLVYSEPPPRIAITTDGHVVKPLEFPGGDIGRLAVCGTVNDLAVSGATPLYLTASFVIEEGLPIATLERVVDSMAHAAAEANVQVVAGDTKVVERGGCDGLFITTTGIGTVKERYRGIVVGRDVQPGDVLLLSGPVGVHGAAIVCARNGLTGDPPIQSDCTPLADMTQSLLDAEVSVHFMRDATRGGIATVLCELAELKHLGMEIEEARIPLDDNVRGVCEMYGFDPLYLANEGSMILAAAPEDAGRALEYLQKHRAGRRAAVIGGITEGPSDQVTLTTRIGGRRVLRMPAGGQLPRIC